MIARIEIKGDWVIKGIFGDGLKKICRIEQFPWQRLSYIADEIFINDVTASLFQTPLSFEKFRKIRALVNKPMIYGGGIQKSAHIEDALKAGFDRIYICTGLFCTTIENNFLFDVTKKYGSSTFLLGLEIILESQNCDLNSLHPRYCRGRFLASKKLMDCIRHIESLSESEISITDLTQEGSETGIDFDTMNHIASLAKYPIIFGGGGSENQFQSSKTILGQNRSIRTLMFSAVPTRQMTFDWKTNG